MNRLLPPPAFLDAQVPKRTQAGSCTTRPVAYLPCTSEKPARFRSRQLLQNPGVLDVACLAESSLSAPTPKASLPVGVQEGQCADGCLRNAVEKKKMRGQSAHILCGRCAMAGPKLGLASGRDCRLSPAPFTFILRCQYYYEFIHF